MRKLSSMVLAGLVALVAGSGAYAQQDLTNAQRDAAVEFTLNNSRHLLLHEIGHLLVHQLDLPVLGREEDAVDTLATLIFLEIGGEEAYRVLVDTVDGWRFSDTTRPGRGYTNSDFYGMHSLDIQRSYAIACLMVGSDFETYSGYATRMGLSMDRQESCQEDYRVAEFGWNAVLTPHLRTDAYGADVAVEYRPDQGTYRDTAEILRQSRVLEEAADWLTKNYVLPRPVRLTAEVCGEPNAFYVPDERRVILCYEWAETFYTMFLDAVLPVREHFEAIRRYKTEKLATLQER